MAAGDGQNAILKSSATGSVAMLATQTNIKPPRNKIEAYGKHSCFQSFFHSTPIQPG